MFLTDLFKLLFTIWDFQWTKRSHTLLVFVGIDFELLETFLVPPGVTQTGLCSCLYIRFRSGLCKGQSNSLILLSLSHFVTTLETCLGSLSHRNSAYGVSSVNQSRLFSSLSIKTPPEHYASTPLLHTRCTLQYKLHHFFIHSADYYLFTLLERASTLVMVDIHTSATGCLQLLLQLRGCFLGDQL